MKLYFAALLAILLIGCATPGSRISDHPETFAQATPEQQQMIRQGQVGLGFTPEFVRLSMGNPDTVTERQDPRGLSQIWHYTNTPNYTYVGGGYGFGYGGRWFGGGGFAPVTVVNAQPQEPDRLRVLFINNKAISIERVVKDGGG